MWPSQGIENAFGPTASIKLITRITVVIHYTSQDIRRSGNPMVSAICRNTGWSTNWKLSSDAVCNNKQLQEL